MGNCIKTQTQQYPQPDQSPSNSIVSDASPSLREHKNKKSKSKKQSKSKSEIKKGNQDKSKSIEKKQNKNLSDPNKKDRAKIQRRNTPSKFIVEKKGKPRIHYTKEGEPLPENMAQCPACNLIIEKIDGDDNIMCGCESRAVGGNIKRALKGGGCGHEFNFKTLAPIGQGQPGKPMNAKQINFKLKLSKFSQRRMRVQSVKYDKLLPVNMKRCPGCGIIIENPTSQLIQMCGGGNHEQAILNGGCGHEFNFKTLASVNYGSKGNPINDRQVKFGVLKKPQSEKKKSFYSDNSLLCPICIGEISDVKKEKKKLKMCKFHPHHNDCLSDWQKKIGQKVKCTICE